MVKKTTRKNLTISSSSSVMMNTGTSNFGQILRCLCLPSEAMPPYGIGYFCQFYKRDALPREVKMALLRVFFDTKYLFYFKKEHRD